MSQTGTTRSSDLVQILVPARFVTQIYGYIGELGRREQAGPPGEPGGGPPEKVETPPRNGGTDSRMGLWTDGKLRRMLLESPQAIRAIVAYLTENPDKDFTPGDLAGVVMDRTEKYRNKEANWNTIAGVLGAFGRRVKNRYGAKDERDRPIWPFDARYDYARKAWVYRMSPAMAERIKKIIEDEPEIFDS